MKILIYRNIALAIFCTSVLSLSSCEKMLRDMATQQTSAERKAQEDSAAVAAATAAPAPAKPKEPEWELTYSKNSEYKDLTPPKGVTPNPFEEIPRITQTHKDNSNWADKHADIKGVLLLNEKKEYYPVLQQQAANEMLRHELFAHYYQEPGNQKVLETIGYYTEHLVEAKSEDAELVYKCLRALTGYWEDKKIAAAAALTAKRVQARPITSAADTTTRNGNYRQIYARELKKMASRLKENG